MALTQYRLRAQSALGGQDGPSQEGVQVAWCVGEGRVMAAEVGNVPPLGESPCRTGFCSYPHWLTTFKTRSPSSGAQFPHGADLVDRECRRHQVPGSVPWYPR